MATSLMGVYRNGRTVLVPAAAVTEADEHPYRSRPAPRCPSHAEPLDGGPVSYYCTPGQHGVMAAELTSEVPR